MRLFIAAPISEQAKDGARLAVDDLRRSRADFKWVEAANLHLTLAFFGEAAEAEVPKLEAAMARACAGRAPFELAFGGLGAFDSLERPRVVWIGLREGAKPLTGLAQALREALEGAGLLSEEEKSRGFQAHLTLGRMRSPRNLAALKARLIETPPKAEFRSTVDRLVLYESRLTSEGPVYREVKTQALV
jgi:2'-5' RNA ligase